MTPHIQDMFDRLKREQNLHFVTLPLSIFQNLNLEDARLLAFVHYLGHLLNVTA